MRELVSHDGSKEERRADGRDDEGLLARPLRELIGIDRLGEVGYDHEEDHDPREVDVDVDAEDARYADRAGHVPSILGLPLGWPPSDQVAVTIANRGRRGARVVEHTSPT